MSDDKQQALHLLTESIKLYFTLSTISIGGVIAFYSNSQSTRYFWLLIVSISCLGISSVISILNVNHLVSKAYKGDYNIYALYATTLNYITIGAFLIGIILSGVLLYLARPSACKKSSSPSKASINGVDINGNNVSIGQNVGTKVIVKRDQAGNITEISINR